MTDNTSTNTNDVHHAVAILSLREWANWYREETAPTRGSSGFSNITSFMKIVTSGGSYNGAFHQSFENEASPTTRVIMTALIQNPLYFSMAQCSFVYRQDYSYSDKAAWMQEVKGLYMGSTPNAARLKVSSLEKQMIAFIAGVLYAIDMPRGLNVVNN